jgi:hypothetical protein
MPYIKQTDRDELERDGALSTRPQDAGELNYCFTKLIVDYLDDSDTGFVSYEKYNEIIGALECCKLELYRRLVAQYEDIKMKENGDVY